MGRFAWTASLSLAAMLASGCGGAYRSKLLPAPPYLLAKCHATAKTVGYPIPCPVRLPQAVLRGCMICLDVDSGQDAWRGWVGGSSETGRGHLVVTASPRPLANDAKFVHGPSWYPAARVRPIARVTVNGRRMHAVYVPAGTCDRGAGSLMNHVVLIWTAVGHTYGVGFQNVHGIHRTLRYDEQLARGIELVAP